MVVGLKNRELYRTYVYYFLRIVNDMNKFTKWSMLLNIKMLYNLTVNNIVGLGQLREKL